jgi:hypothetical protein
MKDKQTSNQNFKRMIALIIVMAGAVGSLYFMFNASSNQKSVFLIACFTVWVLSPFIALLIANGTSKRWSIPNRMTFYFLMLFITIGSLISYGGALSPLESKAPAFKFLIVPLISWLLIVAFIAISRKPSRKRKDIT